MQKALFFEKITKQSNMRYILSLVAIVLCISTALVAQEVNPMASDFAQLNYSDAKTYTIAQVNVKGAERRDDNAIKSITKLREGNMITIPGPAISKAVKELWKLRLFSDVQILMDKVVEDSVYLTVLLQEQPILAAYNFVDIKKTTRDKLTERLDGTFRIGGIVSDNDKEVGTRVIKDYYIDKGYLDADVKITSIENQKKENSIILQVEVDKKERVKIDDIVFIGNEAFSDRKLRRKMKGTKRKGTLFKKSKYIKEKYDEDKKNLIAYYAKNGYSDARITNDSIWRGDDGLVHMAITIDEGQQYKYGKITWKGNSLYTDEQLGAVLGMNAGQVVNPEELAQRIQFSPDGQDVSALYMDKGYLFFNIQPTQVAVRGDSIDIEMRIYEGPQATIDRVIIEGNDRTNEHVIRRVLRTRPGDKFSRSALVRSQREIMNLGYFDAENLGIDNPVNYERGTVDIKYTVVETPSDQLELSAGYGAFNGLIGTLGVTFNNFSIQNIRDRSSWSPLPTGDGQRFTVRLQSNSRFFRSYNMSFTEPWLGGKKPNALSVGFAKTAQDFSFSGSGKLTITNLYAGLGTSLRWPDDFFTSSTTVNYKNLDLQDFVSSFSVSNGVFKDFNINQVLSRSSVASPLYPMGGSRISLSIQFTPPYSLFRSDNFWEYTEQEKDALVQEEIAKIGRRAAESFDADAFISQKEDGRKFEFLEYHKWRVDAEWYYNIVDKLVFMTSAKMGYLGKYNSDIGDIPFERFIVGGDGLSNQTIGIQGSDIIALRGYESSDISPNNANRSGGDIIFNKFTAELRYPLSTNPNSTIYAHIFAQGGNQWDSISDYNPFDLKRSVGAGVRVFLPMFGLLGFDYGFGLDKTVPGESRRNLGSLGKFSIVLGFEPD